MLGDAFTIELLALVLMVTFLVHRFAMRAHARRLERRSKVQPAANTIDVSPIRPRLQALKADFSAAAHSQVDSTRARAGLVAKAKAHLRALSFFRGRTLDPESEQHAH